MVVTPLARMTFIIIAFRGGVMIVITAMRMVSIVAFLAVVWRAKSMTVIMVAIRRGLVAQLLELRLELVHLEATCSK